LYQARNRVVIVQTLYNPDTIYYMNAKPIVATAIYLAQAEPATLKPSSAQRKESGGSQDSSRLHELMTSRALAP